MTRRLIGAAIAALVTLAGTTGCPRGDRPRVCEPGEVREDSFQPGRYWQCSPDGTREDPLNAPGDHAPDPIGALRGTQ